MGDTGDVKVVIPDGAEPHDYQPSAKRVAELNDSSAIIYNGAEFESGLDAAIDNAAAMGVPTFAAFSALKSPIDEDPHFWLDPEMVVEIIGDMADFLEKEIGIDLGKNLKDFRRELENTDRRIQRLVGPIPRKDRKFVADHKALEYFARRYEFDPIGYVVSSTSPDSSPSAKHLSRLRDDMLSNNVRVIFTELGNADDATKTLAAETRAHIVALPIEQIGDADSYDAYMTSLAAKVVEGVYQA